MSLVQTQLGRPLVFEQRQSDIEDSAEYAIFDIRRGQDGVDLRDELEESLRSREHSITVMPELLLWDEEGLQHFEDVTYCPGYYLTNAEISVLEQNSHEIARKIKSDSMLIELGSGYVLLVQGVAYSVGVRAILTSPIPEICARRTFFCRHWRIWVVGLTISLLTCHCRNLNAHFIIYRPLACKMSVASAFSGHMMTVANGSSDLLSVTAKRP